MATHRQRILYPEPYSVYRVSIKKSSGKQERFWARIETRGKRFTIYVPLKTDGDDMSHIDKDGNNVTPKYLVDNTLIISEKPAVYDLRYGEFRVATWKDILED